MKIVEVRSYGRSPEAVAVVEAPEPGAPGPDEAVFDIEAFPINPADLLMLEGRYAVRPPLPTRPLGAECVGRVVAVGAEVRHVAPGDRVISLDRENWVQRKRLKAARLIRLPAEIDPLQAAMLRVNPPTAWLMLTKPVKLERGDWAIQNAANSAVGQWLVGMAANEGWRTLNVVRRPELVEPLKRLGADVVLVDGDDLPARVAAAVDGGRVRLAIDAIGGPASLRLSDCLGEGGVFVNYGLLSGEPCMIRPDQLVFRGVTARGFWLGAELPTVFEEVQALYAGLAARLMERGPRISIAATYPLDRLAEALKHAGREGRGGKVLVLPNGPLA